MFGKQIENGGVLMFWCDARTILEVPSGWRQVRARMGYPLWTIVVAVSCLLVSQSATAQIGNLDWAKQKKGGAAHETDYSSSKLQFQFEPMVGAIKYKSSASSYEYGEYYYRSSDKELLAGLSMGCVYALYRDQVRQPWFDACLAANVEVSDVKFEFDELRLLASIGPEVGIRLRTGEAIVVRPFASFCPGVSKILTGGDWGNREDIKFIWAMRIGCEVGTISGPISGIIGLRLTDLNSASDSYHLLGGGYTQKVDMSSTTLLIGVRIKM